MCDDWLFVLVCWLPVVWCFELFVGSWLLIVVFLLFVVWGSFVCLRVLFVGGRLLCVLSCLALIVRCVVDYCSLFGVNLVSVISCCLQSFLIECCLLRSNCCFGVVCCV